MKFNTVGLESLELETVQSVENGVATASQQVVTGPGESLEIEIKPEDLEYLESTGLDGTLSEIEDVKVKLMSLESLSETIGNAAKRLYNIVKSVYKFVISVLTAALDMLRGNVIPLSGKSYHFFGKLAPYVEMILLESKRVVVELKRSPIFDEGKKRIISHANQVNSAITKIKEIDKEYDNINSVHVNTDEARRLFSTIIHKMDVFQNDSEKVVEALGSDEIKEAVEGLDWADEIIKTILEGVKLVLAKVGQFGKFSLKEIKEAQAKNAKEAEPAKPATESWGGLTLASID